MPRNISASTRLAVTAPQTEKVFLMLIRMYSDELSQDLYFVKNNENIVSNGNTYLATSFNITPPVQEEGNVQDASISIGAVNRQVIEVIRTITKLKVDMSIIRSDTPDDIEAGPWYFELGNVNYNKEIITGTLLHNVGLRNNISIVKVTNITFPGLY